MTECEMIDIETDKRNMRCDDEGKLKESANIYRLLSANVRHVATHDAEPGQGDKGDHKRR
ncbi:hypothetical protein GOZ89_24380 [Agrobacterium vitis]|uniref:hypothetical protein n=1 Tax=Agrobacterium vitis TaxID=373 RepID=UPI0012E82C1C|nr:hypothetical protein [Agrobacterium vitis]MVA82548.1 hypothetical protein [Agrobacterium vitis]